MARLVAAVCVIASGYPDLVYASSCTYSTQWSYLYSEDVTDCELIDLEATLIREAKDFLALNPYMLRVRYARHLASEDDAPYVAFAVLNTPADYPFEERLQLQMQCERMEGASWECKLFSESQIVYHKEKVILVAGTSEEDALTVADGFDSTPIDALIQVLNSHQYFLAPMFRELGWPETLKEIYSIRRNGDTYSLNFGGLQCADTTIQVKRNYCGAPACELNLQNISIASC